MIDDIIFIGNKQKPLYMIEFDKHKKKIIVYKPDKYSLKMKDFFETYYLGEIVYEIKYTKYYYIKTDCKNYLDKHLRLYLLSEILFETPNKYLLIKDDLYESKK
jgi:hypothetical protein